MYTRIRRTIDALVFWFNCRVCNAPLIDGDQSEAMRETGLCYDCEDEILADLYASRKM